MFMITGVSSGIAERLWDSMSHRPGSPWSGEEGKTYVDFLEVLTQSKALLLFDYGFVRVEQSTENGSALCHIIIWSSDALRNLPEIHKGLNELACVQKALTLSFMLPDSIPSLRRLATTLGLTYTSSCRMPDSSSGSIYLYVPRRT